METTGKTRLLCEVTFDPQARRQPPGAGYRPDIVVATDTGSAAEYWGFTFLSLEDVPLGAPALAEGVFTFDDTHADAVKTGQFFRIMEGARQVGSGFFRDVPDKKQPLAVVPMQREHLAVAAHIAKTAPDPWTEAGLEAELCAGHPCVVALVGQTVVGFACFRPVGDAAELAMLVVRPAQRGQGVGRRLLQQGLAQLAQQGFCRCLLEVRASNAAAIALYEKLGFARLARRPGLYSHPPEDGLTMEKQLLLYKPEY